MIKPRIEKARELYAVPSNDDIEIDDNPRTSKGDGGCWVAAWVWVTDEEAGFNNEEGEEDE